MTAIERFGLSQRRACALVSVDPKTLPSDVFEPGRRFRILAVIDDGARDNLALVADISISGARVARELDRLIRLYAERRLS